MKPDEALEAVRRGASIIVAPGAAEPTSLTGPLMARRHELQPLRLLLGLSISGTFEPGHADAVRFSALGLFGRNAVLSGAEGVEVLPIHYGQVPRLVESGDLVADVLLVQLAPPDREGRCSVGIASEYIAAAVRGGAAVIAEINDRVPVVEGAASIPFESLAAACRTSRDVLVVAPREPGERARAAGRHLAAILPDGACLQVGLGGMLDGALTELSAKRRLRIHSGLITDAVRDLVEAGAVATGPGSEEITGTALLGSLDLYQWAARQPRLRLRGVEHTHSPLVMGELDAFHSINAALEVDLLGQVNAEVSRGRYIGGVGGAPGFSHAAQLSPGGGSVFVLPAAGSDGGSRIVERLPAGLVTTPAADVGIVVTEWGAADLRGASIRERGARLAAIAPPDQRPRLAARAAEPGGWG